jgi:hypothetical protein
MYLFKKQTLLAVGLLLMLSACGGGGSSSQSSTTTSTGVFIDSPVQGLSYVSGDESGITDAAGSFTYEVGQSVTFSLGGITIGTAVGADRLTPLDFVPLATDETNPVVTNILRFLQSLDDDNDPDNGITLIEAVRTQAAELTLDFDQSIADFENDGAVLTAIAELTALTSAGAHMLVTTSSAQIHFNGTLIGLFVGDYSGSFTGDDSGTFTFTIAADGTISGEGSGTDESFTVTGAVNSDGSAAAGNVSTGASFVMQINQNGSVTGTWSNSLINESGTFTANKINPPPPPPPSGNVFTITLSGDEAVANGGTLRTGDVKANRADLTGNIDSAIIVDEGSIIPPQGSDPVIQHDDINNLFTIVVGETNISMGIIANGVTRRYACSSGGAIFTDCGTGLNFDLAGKKVTFTDTTVINIDTDSILTLNGMVQWQ